MVKDKIVLEYQAAMRYRSTKRSKAKTEKTAAAKAELAVAEERFEKAKKEFLHHMENTKNEAEAKVEKIKSAPVTVKEKKTRAPKQKDETIEAGVRDAVAYINKMPGTNIKQKKQIAAKTYTFFLEAHKKVKQYMWISSYQT
jgi:hypothetical protein